jgi:hypothetical protein
VFGMKDIIDEEKLVKGIAEVVIPALAVAARAVAREALQELAGMGVTVTITVNGKREPQQDPPKE